MLRKAVEASGGRAFFGVTSGHTSRHTPRLLEALREDELLVESDASEDLDAKLGEAVALVAGARGWSHEEAVAVLDGNAWAFLGVN